MSGDELGNGEITGEVRVTSAGSQTPIYSSCFGVGSHRHAVLIAMGRSPSPRQPTYQSIAKPFDLWLPLQTVTGKQRM